ncbi:hypothetical protein DVY19_04300 [Enterococcus faecium]|nr:hypothetical protein [Enterococcus faecium]RXW42464.1 hypothetical protein CYQ83_09380 [Enterococcus faecium]RXW78639.1 hypothetical protein CYQ67_04115 [Enterococcus faecium]RXX07677.1 hypothetical protein CYQ54_04400 [Enterococcus faecium]TKO56950.1 hypothetical protein DVY19_04300 [Enterococcus faecium]
MQTFLSALFFLHNYLISFPFSSIENLLFLLVVRIELISFFYLFDYLAFEILSFDWLHQYLFILLYFIYKIYFLVYFGHSFIRHFGDIFSIYK